VEHLLLARPQPELRLRRPRPAASRRGPRRPPVPLRRAQSQARRPQRRRPTGRNSLRRRLRLPSRPGRQSSHRCHLRRARRSVT
jgi:hypothetical protein